jgi:hypothetical protein
MPDFMSPAVLETAPAEDKHAVRLMDLKAAISYPPAGTERATGGTWIDGRSVWVRVFTADSAMPGLSGYLLGTVPQLRDPVRFEGYGRLAGDGSRPTVLINGSGFSGSVGSDGSIMLYGPEGVTLYGIRFIILYTRT